MDICPYPKITKTIRTFAAGPKAGVCIWYDDGPYAMTWLHENYGADFDTPPAIWLKIARAIEFTYPGEVA